MVESKITVSAGGTSFVGPDATNLFRAATLRSALGLLKRGIQPTRGYTRTRALAACTEYTGQRYWVSDAELDRAMADLTVWIETMKSALPVEHKS
jgi:hypothetical protein